ncbi:hypothetical protein [Ruegeria profundi]|uniref:hypothetical protein n=1 Tax=Ruegeria profundi TaxID=1685378 RepID=UPI003C7C39B0
MKIEFLGALLPAFALLALFTFYPTMGQSHGDCAQIENDIARLSCFDNSHVSSVQSNVSPMTAYIEHSNLLYSGWWDGGRGQIVNSAFDDTNCNYVFGRLDGSLASGFWFNAIAFNAGEIERINVQGNRTLFTMKRRAELAFHWAESRQTLPDQGSAERFLAIMLNTILEDEMRGEAIKLEYAPTQKLSITTPESAVDYDKIKNSLTDLVQTCESR